MSYVRVDTSDWLGSTYVLVGLSDGFGLRGDQIPSTGTDGPGYAYNDLSLPADAAKEICGRVGTLPSGTLTTYEDTSFVYSGSSSSFTYQLYVDGVATGSPATATLNVNANQTAAPGVANVSVAGFAPTLTQSALHQAQPGAGALTLTGFAPAMTQSVQGVASPGAGAVSLTGFAPSMTRSVLRTAQPGAGGVTLTGYAPTMAQSGPQLIAPAPRVIALTGFAPTVVRSGQSTPSPERTLAIDAAARWYELGAETRVLTISGENLTLAVPAGDQRTGS